MSFSDDDGTGFVGISPSVSRVIDAHLRFRIDHLLADGVLFTPREMEHKWAIFYHQGRIICVRSWLRQVEVIAETRQHGAEIEIQSIQGVFADDDEEPSLTARCLNYLLRSHALNMVYPVPLPRAWAENPDEAALRCFSLFGNMALIATPFELADDVPEDPLRTNSLLHIAVARGDKAAVQHYLKAGVPIDLLGQDGLPPLHWSFACESPGMTEFLLEAGSPVDVRSAEGATPLMSIVQAGNSAVTGLLIRRGADVNAIDHRGFTALHRAAELGHAELVKLLLDHGAARSPEAQGYTPRDLAEKRGHREILSMLEAV